MKKKIAVLVRDRQEEALRMSIGLTLMDDSVDVFLLNRKLERSDVNKQNVETLRDLDMHVYSNVEEDDQISFVPPESVGVRLLDYDHILPY